MSTLVSKLILPKIDRCVWLVPMLCLKIGKHRSRIRMNFQNRLSMLVTSHRDSPTNPRQDASELPFGALSVHGHTHGELIVT